MYSKPKKSAGNLMKKMGAKPAGARNADDINMSRPGLKLTGSNPDRKAISAGGGRIMAIKRLLRKG